MLHCSVNRYNILNFFSCLLLSVKGFSYCQIKMPPGINFLFFVYQVVLFFSAFKSKSKFNLQFCFHKIIILPCFLEKALLSQRLMKFGKIQHSGLLIPPLLTLEFGVSLLMAGEMGLCPPCNIFNLNLFSNVNKFSFF